jgi:predicted transcriptional regulator
MSPDAELLLELRERGHFDSADALEICSRCWRRADRAIRELQRAGVVKRANKASRKQARWKFVG